MSEFLSTSAVWGVMLTMGAFALGSWLHRRTGKAWMNPLLLGSIFVVVLLSVLGIPYQDYKASAAPVSYLLLPATISLAIPLYEKLDLLRRNAVAILGGDRCGQSGQPGQRLAVGRGAGYDPGTVCDPVAQVCDHRHQHGRIR